MYLPVTSTADDYIEAMSVPFRSLHSPLTDLLLICGFAGARRSRLHLNNAKHFKVSA